MSKSAEERATAVVYLLLVAVGEAFKNLKGALAIRPVFHQLEARIEAHVFIAFLPPQLAEILPLKEPNRPSKPGKLPRCLGAALVAEYAEHVR